MENLSPCRVRPFVRMRPEQIAHALQQICGKRQRCISVEILQRNRLVYFKVVNDAPGDPFDEKRRLRTTKDDSDGLHGLGIANILDAARRNGGELKNEYKDGKFYSTAMISLEM